MDEKKTQKMAISGLMLSVIASVSGQLSGHPAEFVSGFCLGLSIVLLLASLFSYGKLRSLKKAKRKALGLDDGGDLIE